jgi:nitrogen fixation protein NifU and related proteins
MAELGDDFYRENILDHYKSPRNYGALEGADAYAEGMNPLCGDETAITVRFGEDGETIEDIRFQGRGCAISVASTSMLTELVKGRTADEVAGMSKDELLEDMPPLTPVRLKCALLGLTTLKVALHRAKGTPPPEGLAGLDELELT